MDVDIVGKTYIACNTEKRSENFYRKYSKRRAGNIKRVLKRYFDTKDEILQQRRDKYARFKDLEFRLKAL